MPARKRANGPYKHGNRWRVVLSPPPSDGTSRYLTFDTEREATDYVSLFAEETDNRSLGATVTEFLEAIARHGVSGNRPLRASSVQRVRYHLESILQLREGDRPLTNLTPLAASKMYSALVARGVRTDTHRGSLVAAGQFGRWCEKEGRLRANPFAEVKPEGTRTAGKVVLKIDDARMFLAAALNEETAEGLACAHLLVLALRVSELCDRVVDDVNRDPILLNVPKGKTRKAKRLLSVPAPLGPLLLAHIDGRPRDAKLFNLSRYALHYHTARLCRVAGVPTVCPHGLSGSAATNIVGGSTPGADVHGLINRAREQLGHENTTVTRDHYIAPGTIESAEAEAKARLLIPGNKLETQTEKQFPMEMKVEVEGWN